MQDSDEEVEKEEGEESEINSSDEETPDEDAEALNDPTKSIYELKRTLTKSEM